MSDKAKRLRIYLDTTIVNFLFADDAPNLMEDTILFWKECIAGKYKVLMSDVVYDELKRCPEPKRTRLYEELNRIEFEVLAETEEVRSLAAEYVKAGVLTEKHLTDCLHIACAVVSNCDALVSWNFDHLVRYNTIEGVKVVNAINRYKGIAIVSPTMLIDKEDV